MLDLRRMGIWEEREREIGLSIEMALVRYIIGGI